MIKDCQIILSELSAAKVHGISHMRLILMLHFVTAIDVDVNYIFPCNIMFQYNLGSTCFLS